MSIRKAVTESLGGARWLLEALPVTNRVAMLELIKKKKNEIIIGRTVPLDIFLTIRTSDVIQTIENGELLVHTKLFRYANGTVVIQEIPTFVHDTVGYEFGHVLMATTEPVFGFQDRLIPHGTGTTHNAAGMGGEADGAFTTRRRPTVPGGCDGKGNAWPNLVFETAYSQPFAQAESKILTYWLPAGVQIVVLFLIGQQEYVDNRVGNLVPGTLRSQQVYVYYPIQYAQAGVVYTWFGLGGVVLGNGVAQPVNALYCRTNSLDFGYVDGAGNFNAVVPAIGVHFITLPIAALLHGAPGGVAGFPPTILIDLFRITDSLTRTE